MKTVFSGVQPSGNLHIGNYGGALRPWVGIQESVETHGLDLFFCIVDLHAITVHQDPEILKEKVLEVAALYIACGIDPEKSHIFVQSENPDHAYLAWILNTITTMGQLYRMTQFKDKIEREYRKSHKISEEEKLSALGEARVQFDGPVGLFDYPVLMAADILLYQTELVPVGEDQKQHIELARDLAEKFNNTFGNVFTIPSYNTWNDYMRIMNLQNPSRKMGKSDLNSLGRINLLDSEEDIREKIKKAVTDSGSQISRDYGSPAISNLISIFALFNNQSFDMAYSDLEGKSYGEFKNVLAGLVVEKLSQIQKKYQEIRNDESYLRKVLDEGRDFAISKSSQTLNLVKDKVGLL